jgi:hypothetical protein
MPPELDPLKRAQVLARFDRVEEAIVALRESIQRQPERTDLKQELQVLERQHSHLGTFGSAKHQVTGWALLLGSFAIVFAPFAVVIQWLESSTRASDWFLGVQGAVLLLVFLALAVGLVFVSLWLFLRLWFARLAQVPAGERHLAEAALSRGMALHLFEPIYTTARERYIRDTDA